MAVDLRAEDGSVTTVAELDWHLDRITGEIACYHSRVGNEFISVGHAAPEATVNKFDVLARALILVEQAR